MYNTLVLQEGADFLLSMLFVLFKIIINLCILGHIVTSCAVYLKIRISIRIRHVLSSYDITVFTADNGLV